MYFLIVPLLGSLYGSTVKYIGKEGACYGIIVGLFLGLINTVMLFKKVCLENIIIIYEWSWMEVGQYKLSITFVMDQLTIIMAMLIIAITLLVMIYSKGYMEGDPNVVKFLSYLSFFCFCMLLLVSAGNFIQLFIGWEGVGLASYLLISFWTPRNLANQGAIKAVIVNRVGDVCFLLALGFLGVAYKSFDFSIVFLDYPNITKAIEIPIIGGFSMEISTLIALLLGIAACAKSAQIFLHTWLPDAMEGPTPVSALLHSATMVTAGVFLIIRCSPIYANVPSISYMLAVVGIMTAIISGVIGANQYDLKKIIAYSTCSQLGFMFFGAGLGYYNYVLYHLVTHAFFKCLLFLCAGSVIHAMGDEQDIRKMGNLCLFLPVTCVCMLLGTLALIGFPMFSGFYSKELLLETAMITPILGNGIYFLACFSVFLTSFYSLRVLYFCFYNENSTLSKGKILNIKEAPFSMMFPMVILAVASIFSGYFVKEIFTGPEGLIFMQNSIYMSPSAVICEAENSNNILMQHLPSLSAFCGIAWCLIYFSSFNFVKESYGTRYSLSLTGKLKFNFDSLYNLVFSRFTFFFAYVQYKVVDRGLLEAGGPGGFNVGISLIINRLLTFVTHGYLLHALLIIIGVCLFLIFMVILF